MALTNAPGVWRWEQRGEAWWRIHDALSIEAGPYLSTDRDAWIALAANGLAVQMDECRQAGIDPIPLMIDELRRMGYTVTGTA